MINSRSEHVLFDSEQTCLCTRGVLSRYLSLSFSVVPILRMGTTELHGSEVSCLGHRAGNGFVALNLWAGCHQIWTFLCSAEVLRRVSACTLCETLAASDPLHSPGRPCSPSDGLMPFSASSARLPYVLHTFSSCVRTCPGDSLPPVWLGTGARLTSSWGPPWVQD